MDAIEAIISDVEEFCARHGMKETTFGRLAVNDGKLVARLRAGGSVTLKTAGDIRAFLNTPRPSRAPSDGSGALPDAAGSLPAASLVSGDAA